MADERPVCAECKSFIEDNKVVRLGKRAYHVQHFCCTHCNRSVAGEEYIELDDAGTKRACEGCFAKMKTAERCEKCKEIIFGDAIANQRDHKKYHLACFRCTRCHVQLSDKYGVVGGMVVCGSCKSKADNAQRCVECGQPIHGEAKVAENKWHHPNCFRCTTCKEILTGEYQEAEGKFYCKKDYSAIFPTENQCAECRLGIQKKDIYEVNNRKYHSKCFNCLTCKKNLYMQNFGTWAGKPFCPDCYKKL